MSYETLQWFLTVDLIESQGTEEAMNFNHRTTPNENMNSKYVKIKKPSSFIAS